jgi:integrase
VKAKKPHAVPLTPAVMAILERRFAESAPGERFVFPSPRSKAGHVVEKSGEGSFWRRITIRAGLYDKDDSDQTLRVHDLRRSLASFSVERGASIQAVSKLLGHSDISITASTYAHLNVDAVRGELVETERLMLADPTTKKLEALRDQVLALTLEDQTRLLAMVEEIRQTAAR